MIKPKSSPLTKVEALHTGDVFAFIVGIEEYQARRGAQIRSVDFARADAQSFADVLRRIFPRVQIALQVDSDATRTNIDDALKREIAALEPPR